MTNASIYEKFTVMAAQTFLWIILDKNETWVVPPMRVSCLSGSQLDHLSFVKWKLYWALTRNCWWLSQQMNRILVYYLRSFLLFELFVLIGYTSTQWFIRMIHDHLEKTAYWGWYQTLSNCLKQWLIITKLFYQVYVEYELLVSRRNKKKQNKECIFCCCKLLNNTNKMLWNKLQVIF